MSASGTSRQLVATLNSVAIGGTADIMRADWLLPVRVHSISCESERGGSKEAQPRGGGGGASAILRGAASLTEFLHAARLFAAGAAWCRQSASLPWATARRALRVKMLAGKCRSLDSSAARLA